MEPLLKLVPRAAIFLAGIAAGALTISRREGAGMDAAALGALKKSLADVEQRLAATDEAHSTRLDRLEARQDEQAVRLDEHATRLADLPSTTQIVTAMEQLLQKTMAGLDERLSTQAHSIEVLKTTVSQTDSLLERVLESLDALQTYSEPAASPEDATTARRA